MTWVIGGTTLFGYGVGISDVRVTFQRPDGTYFFEDCLQKIYPVGNFIIAGFAGSVKIGFSLVVDLTKYLELDNPEQAWIPEWVAINWRRRARRIFRIASDEEQKLGSSIFLIGIHPTVNLGESPWAKGTTCILRAPEYEPMFFKTNEFVSIGSGSDIDIYKNTLIEASTIQNPSLKQESAYRGGFGDAVSWSISTLMWDHHDRTVSKHHHIFLVERGNISIKENNYTSYTKQGEIEFKMPWVAKSPREFYEFCKSKNIGSALASC